MQKYVVKELLSSAWELQAKISAYQWQQPARFGESMPGMWDTHGLGNWPTQWEDSCSWHQNSTYNRDITSLGNFYQLLVGGESIWPRSKPLWAQLPPTLPPLFPTVSGFASAAIWRRLLINTLPASAGFYTLEFYFWADLELFSLSFRGVFCSSGEHFLGLHGVVQCSNFVNPYESFLGIINLTTGLAIHWARKILRKTLKFLNLIGVGRSISLIILVLLGKQTINQ